MTTAALYARISRDPNGTEKGVQRQIEDARLLAEMRGWDVVGEFVDNDTSAYSGAHREAYERMMALALDGKIEQIVVWHSSRLWRNRTERAAAIDRLGAKGLKVIAIRGQEMDLGTAYGRMMAGFVGEFDTAESEVKSERLKRAALQRAQEGRAAAFVSFGWKRVYDIDSAGRTIGFHDVENPDEADIVREVVDRILAGDTLRGICTDLNARGVLTGRRKPGLRWTMTTLRQLAMRKSNIALRVHRKDVIGPADWPAIIPEGKFLRVCALLADPSRRMSRDGKKRHLLTHNASAVCGVCGGQLKVHRVSRVNGTRHSEYQCFENYCISRDQGRVDELVRAVVVEVLRQPEAVDAFAPDENAYQRARDRVGEIRARLDGAADLFTRGEIDAQQYGRNSASLRPQLIDAEAALRATMPVALPESIQRIQGENAAASWDELGVAQQQRVITALGIVIRIMPAKLRRVFDASEIVISDSRYRSIDSA